MKSSLNLLRTIAWLRWRLLLGGLGRANRGRLESISRTLGVLLQVLLGLGATGFAVGLAVAATVAAWRYDQPAARAVFAVGSSVVLSVVLMMTVVFAGKSGTGEMLDSPRLQLLPLRRMTLHRLQVIAALVDPLILALTPALAAFPVTLLLRGRVAVAVTAAAAGLLWLFLLAAFASAAAGVLQLLLRGRRRREAVLLVVALGFGLLAIGPSMLGQRAGAGSTATPGQQHEVRLRFEAWSHLLRFAPPLLYAAASEQAAQSGAAAALPALFALALWGGGAYAVSSAAFRRLHASPAGTARHTAAANAVTTALRPVPLLPSTVGTLAAAQWRSLSRTTLARMAFLMTPIMVVVIARGLGDVSRFTGPWLSASGMLVAVSGPFALLGLNQLVVNQFAFDGDGLARQVLLPVSAAQLIQARRGSALVLAAGVGLLTLATAAIAEPRPSGLLLALVALGTAGAARVCLPCALLLSAYLPKTVDPTKLGRASQPHQGAVLLWMPLVGAVCGPLWAAGGLLWRYAGPAAAFAAAVLWLAAAWLISRPLERAAAAAFTARREALLLVAGGR